MFSWLLQCAAPDAEVAYRGRWFSALVFIFLSFYILLSGLYQWQGQHVLAVAQLVRVVALFPLYLLVRRGHLIPAVMGTVTVLGAAQILGPLATQPRLLVALTNPLYLVVALLIAAVFLSGRQLVGMIGACYVGTIWYYYVAPIASLTDQRRADPQTFTTIVIGALGFFTLVGGITWLGNQMLLRTLTDLRRRNTDLDEAQGQLIRANLDLEARVQARTTALQASETRLAALFQSNPLAISLNRVVDGTILDINPAWEALSGYSRAEAVGHTTVELGVWADAVSRAQMVEQLAAQGHLREFETAYRDKAGVVQPCLAWVEPLTLDGERYVLGIIQNISARRQAEQALGESEARYRSLVEQSYEAILLSAPDGRILEANRAAAQLFGWSAAEICRRGRAGIVDTSDPRLAQMLAERARTGHVRAELRFLRADDGSFPGEVTSTVFTDRSGQLRTSMIIRDLSARKQLEAAQEAARQAAESANQAKSLFLANMSHELRTPLTAILGYSELLQEDAVALGVVNLVSDLVKIQKAADHLLVLINDVLDLSKIEAGKLAVVAESFAIGELLDEVAALIAPLVAQRHNHLQEERTALPATLRADRMRVRQVLLNLLSNAAKFTQGGTIRLRAWGTDGGVSFAVEDNGIGIAPDVLGTLFQPFTQADAETARHYGGTGLGLALSRRLCELMGGTIQAVSTPGQGSTFTVWLPLHNAATEWDVLEFALSTSR